MNIREVQSLIESGTVDYYSVLNSWESVKPNQKAQIIEALFEHAEETRTLPQFLEGIIDSSYVPQHKHNRREIETLVNLVGALNWIEYANRIKYLEEETDDNKEFKQEEKLNTANVLIHYKLDKYQLLRTTLNLISLSKRKDKKDVIGSVYKAFTLGYNVGLDFLEQNSFGWFEPESEYEEVYNLKHEDKNYKPAIQKARNIFEERQSRLKKLIPLGILSEDQVECYNENGFGMSMEDEGFSYLMCMPYVEDIEKLQEPNKVELAKKVFNILYETATFAFHLAIKEKVEKQVRVHSSIFPDLDLSTYRQFHEV